MKFKKYITLLLLATCFIIYGQSDKNELKVDVALFSPCVIQEDGKLTGFDIEIWETICKDLNYTSKYNIIPFSKILKGLEAKTTDIAIAGISITSDRENNVDFSHHYLDSGLSILVKNNKKQANIIPVIINKLFTLEMLYLLGILFILLLIWGIALWRAEKGADVISDVFSKGFPDATWCSWAIMTTIGFGDIYPKTMIGRLLTVPIFLTGCVIVGVVSAPVITAFTVRDIDVIDSQIQKVSDLRGKKVATKKSSTSQKFLNSQRGIELYSKKSIYEAYKSLEQGEVNAVVFDSPGIYYYAKNNPSTVAIVGGIFEKQYYGIATQKNSSLRKKINQSLLKIRENGDYEKIYKKWFEN